MVKKIFFIALSAIVLLNSSGCSQKESANLTSVQSNLNKITAQDSSRTPLDIIETDFMIDGYINWSPQNEAGVALCTSKETPYAKSVLLYQEIYDNRRK